MPKTRKSEFDYDVCLSFAGNDRDYVEKVAKALAGKGVRVFYDRYEEVGLWGKDLYCHLADIYESAARYCVMFISKHYAKRLWTNHERRNAQARAFRENSEYVLPVRFDKTAVPGLPETVGYLDLRRITPGKLTSLIIRKLGPRQRKNYFPPSLDKLFASLGVTNSSAAIRNTVESHAECFFSALKRMSDDERKTVYFLMRSGCPNDLPVNMHINLDLLRRHTGFTVRKLTQILGGIRSLGFLAEIREESHGSLGKSQIGYIEWHNLTIDAPGNATHIAAEIVEGATIGHCAECGMASFMRLDFSQLSTVTTEIDDHL